MKKAAIYLASLCFFLTTLQLFTLACWAPTAAFAAPKPGGTLEIGITFFPVNLGYPPKLNKEYDHMVARTALETLIIFGENGAVKPALATSWEIAADLTSIIFKLRKGVKFHDGTDFNAQAAKFNLELQKEAGRAELKNVSQVAVLDDHTIKIIISKWDSILLTSLGYHAGLMASPTAIKTKGMDWALTHPVGTGPFKFSGLERDVSIKFEKFDRYWQKGKPYLDSIEWISIADPMTAQASLKRKEIDVMIGLDPKDAKRFKDSGEYTVEEVPGGIYGFAGDGANETSPFANVKVRKALNYAINKKVIADKLGHGFYEPLDQPSGKYSWSYNPDIKGYPYNPEKAKELLAEAGYPNGFKTVLFSPTVPQALVDTFIAAQGFLSEVGIDVKIDKKELGALYKMIVGGSWEGLIDVEHGRQTPDDLRVLRNAYHSDSILWKKMHKPKDVDNAIEEASKAATFKEQKKWVHEANRLITDEHCLVTLLYLSKAIAIEQPYVQDLGLFKIVQPQFLAADAWMNK